MSYSCIKKLHKVQTLTELQLLAPHSVYIEVIYQYLFFANLGVLFSLLNAIVRQYLSAATLLCIVATKLGAIAT